MRRIKLNRQGYTRGGVYWGVGERLYYCPELTDIRERTSVFYVEPDLCRAPDVSRAREIFRARAERMVRHPRPEGGES